MMQMGTASPPVPGQEGKASVKEKGTGAFSFLELLSGAAGTDKEAAEGMDEEELLALLTEERADKGEHESLLDLSKWEELFETMALEDGYFQKELLEDGEVQALLESMPEELARTLEDAIKDEESIEQVIDLQSAQLDPLSLLSATAMLFKQTENTESDEALQVQAEMNEWLATLDGGEEIEEEGAVAWLAAYLNSNESSANSLHRQEGLVRERTFEQRFDRSMLDGRAGERLEREQTQVQRTENNRSSSQSFMQELLNRTFTRSADSAVGQPSLQLSDTNQALNRAQQLAIHMGESKSSEVQQSQFLRQFENVLAKGNLQQVNQHTQQLSIKLYPENLGRLDVQLTRSDEGVIARLMTSSTAARELVESQLHQLRNAFQQQNINIERIELQQQSTYWQQHEEREQRKGQQEQQDKDKVEAEVADDQEEEEKSFEELLDELTFNEKV